MVTLQWLYHVPPVPLSLTGVSTRWVTVGDCWPVSVVTQSVNGSKAPNWDLGTLRLYETETY